MVQCSADILGHEITHYDLPEFDVHDYDQLVEKARGHDAIVHLAWDMKSDNFKSDHLNPDKR